MSVSRTELTYLIEQLGKWFDKKMFVVRRAPAPVYAKPRVQITALHDKEKKRGAYRDQVLKRIEAMEREGWTATYTDGSAKQVSGWWQAGYGVFFAEQSIRNYGAPVPPEEQHSVLELRGVLHALRTRRPDERMVIVLGSEYVFKGIMDWSPKWRRHGWRTSSGEVGHRDLWEMILDLREAGGTSVSCPSPFYVPSAPLRAISSTKFGV